MGGKFRNRGIEPARLRAAPWKHRVGQAGRDHEGSLVQPPRSSRVIPGTRHRTTSPSMTPHHTAGESTFMPLHQEPEARPGSGAAAADARGGFTHADASGCRCITDPAHGPHRPEGPAPRPGPPFPGRPKAPTHPRCGRGGPGSAAPGLAPPAPRKGWGRPPPLPALPPSRQPRAQGPNTAPAPPAWALPCPASPSRCSAPCSQARRSRGILEQFLFLL